MKHFIYYILFLFCLKKKKKIAKEKGIEGKPNYIFIFILF